MKVEKIPEVFSSQLRLAIISSLISGQMFFTDLKQATGASDGNLSVQLKKLTQGGYITSERILNKEKLATLYELTDKGLQEFEDYVSLLESILQQKHE